MRDEWRHCVAKTARAVVDSIFMPPRRVEETDNASARC